MDDVKRRHIIIILLSQWKCSILWRFLNRVAAPTKLALMTVHDGSGCPLNEIFDKHTIFFACACGFLAF